MHAHRYAHARCAAWDADQNSHAGLRLNACRVRARKPKQASYMLVGGSLVGRGGPGSADCLRPGGGGPGLHTSFPEQQEQAWWPTGRAATQEGAFLADSGGSWGLKSRTKNAENTNSKRVFGGPALRASERKNMHVEIEFLVAICLNN